MPHRQKQPAQFCGRTRREFLWQAGGGFASVALAEMLAKDGFFENQAVAADGVTPYANPLAAKPPTQVGKAKSVIFLFYFQLILEPVFHF